MTKDEYEVGYGKPPAATKFQPGKSGNPKGRPRKSDLLKRSRESSRQERTIDAISVATIKARIREIDTEIAELRAKQAGLETALNIAQGLSPVVEVRRK